MLLGNLCHADAHLAVWNKIIAEKNKEWLVAYAVCSAQHRMTKATRIVLIGKGNRKRRSCMNLLGKVLLSARREIGFKLLIFSKVRFNLWLLARIDDDCLIDLFWLKSLFYYVLNNGLIQNRQQLFRGYLCCFTYEPCWLCTPNVRFLEWRFCRR